MRLHLVLIASQMKKYDFQKPSKIPYPETTNMPTRILLKNAV